MAIKTKFSLRFFLICFTLATIFLGGRLNQRRNLLRATAIVKESGGVPLYVWQRPEQHYISLLRSGSNVPVTRSREVSYTINMPDGTKEKRVRSVPFSAPSPIGLAPTVVERPKSAFVSFLLGTHDGINVTSVSIDAKSVDEELAAELRQLTKLQVVVLRLDRGYFELPEEDIHSFESCFLAAESLIKKHNADVTIYKGITIDSLEAIRRWQ